MEVRIKPDPKRNQCVRSGAVEWQALDEPGVHGVYVKVLRYDASARRAPTILLKFDPGATYPGHIHPGGENIHAVQSEAGCVILVSVPQEVEKLERKRSGASVAAGEA